jgi:hypothetical protein
MRLGPDAIASPWGRDRVRRGRLRRALAPILLVLLALAYLAWPYVALWRLDRALVHNDRRTLARLVDLGAVRGEIARKLNKDEKSSLGPPSDAFIAWLEQGIRRNGTAALERRVDHDWVRARLLSHSPPGGGLLSALTLAFFDDPLHFAVRIGPADQAPVHLRLTFDGLGWRVTALSH